MSSIWGNISGWLRGQPNPPSMDGENEYPGSGQGPTSSTPISSIEPETPRGIPAEAASDEIIREESSEGTSVTDFAQYIPTRTSRTAKKRKVVFKNDRTFSSASDIPPGVFEEVGYRPLKTPYRFPERPARNIFEEPPYQRLEVPMNSVSRSDLEKQTINFPYCSQEKSSYPDTEFLFHERQVYPSPSHTPHPHNQSMVTNPGTPQDSPPLIQPSPILPIYTTPRQSQYVSSSQQSRYPSLHLATSSDSHYSRRKKEKEPSKYDGKTDLADYLFHFSKVAKRNGWDYANCGIELATCLMGEAREVLSCLPIEIEDDYNTLVNALSTRFDPEGKESKYSADLMERTCLPREDVATYGHQLKRLARKAYPSNDLPERVLIDLFIRGLPSEEMKRHVSSFEPASYAEAIRRATLCETYGDKSATRLRKPDASIAPVGKVASARPVPNSQDQPTARPYLANQAQQFQFPTQSSPPQAYPSPGPPQYPPRVPPLMSTFPQYQNTSAQQSLKVPRPRSEITCFSCGCKGHYASECPGTPAHNNTQMNKPNMPGFGTAPTFERRLN